MASIDLTPQILDLKLQGGDTTNLLVTFPPGFVSGRIWKADIRATALATSVDGTFTVTLGATADDPVTITLPAALSRSLITSVALRELTAEQKRAAARSAGDPLASYKGVWDCQLAPSGGGDPTTTIVKGSIEITLDVTRTP